MGQGTSAATAQTAAMFLPSSHARPAARMNGSFVKKLSLEREAALPFGMTVASIGTPYSASSAVRIAALGVTTTSAAVRPALTAPVYRSRSAGADARLTALHHVRTHEWPTTTTGFDHSSDACT